LLPFSYSLSILCSLLSLSLCIFPALSHACTLSLHASPLHIGLFSLLSFCSSHDGITDWRRGQRREGQFSLSLLRERSAELFLREVRITLTQATWALVFLGGLEEVGGQRTGRTTGSGDIITYKHLLSVCAHINSIYVIAIMVICLMLEEAGKYVSKRGVA